VFRQSLVVDESLTVSRVANCFVGLADLPPVFATAFMVGLVEWTCIGALRPYLLEGEHTIGTLIDVSHVAAKPIGLNVTAEVRLLAVVGRRLRFRVTCYDERELIGEGCHERAVINTASFARRAEQKRGTIGLGDGSRPAPALAPLDPDA
jgi:fluoroacetyl-CoA thioesterase